MEARPGWAGRDMGECSNKGNLFPDNEIKIAELYITTPPKATDSKIEPGDSEKLKTNNRNNSLQSELLVQCVGVGCPQ